MAGPPRDEPVNYRAVRTLVLDIGGTQYKGLLCEEAGALFGVLPMGRVGTQAGVVLTAARASLLGPPAPDGTQPAAFVLPYELVAIKREEKARVAHALHRIAEWGGGDNTLLSTWVLRELNRDPVARLFVPRLVDTWQDAWYLYTVTSRYVGDLRTWLSAQPAGVIDEATARDVIASTLRALDAMHALGWCHRDVAPDNVLVAPAEAAAATPGGRPRPTLNAALNDFGTACAMAVYAPPPEAAGGAPPPPTRLARAWTAVAALPGRRGGSGAAAVASSSGACAAPRAASSSLRGAAAATAAAAAAPPPRGPLPRVLSDVTPPSDGGFSDDLGDLDASRFAVAAGGSGRGAGAAPAPPAPDCDDGGGGGGGGDARTEAMRAQVRALEPPPASPLGGWVVLDPPATPAGIFGKVKYGDPLYLWRRRYAGVGFDLYSVGCTLFFVLAGRELYEHARPDLDAGFAALWHCELGDGGGSGVGGAGDGDGGGAGDGGGVDAALADRASRLWSLSGLGGLGGAPSPLAQSPVASAAAAHSPTGASASRKRGLLGNPRPLAAAPTPVLLARAAHSGPPPLVRRPSTAAAVAAAAPPTDGASDAAGGGGGGVPGAHFRAVLTELTNPARTARGLPALSPAVCDLLARLLRLRPDRRPLSARAALGHAWFDGCAVAEEARRLPARTPVVARPPPGVVVSPIAAPDAGGCAVGPAAGGGRVGWPGGAVAAAAAFGAGAAPGGSVTGSGALSHRSAGPGAASMAAAAAGSGAPDASARTAAARAGATGGAASVASSSVTDAWHGLRLHSGAPSPTPRADSSAAPLPATAAGPPLGQPLAVPVQQPRQLAPDATDGPAPAQSPWII